MPHKIFLILRGSQRKDKFIKSTIKLTGITTEGKHGANPGEQDSAQTFVVDVIAQLEVSGDEVAQTVDYEELARIVKNQIENNSYKLIETLAYNIASEINGRDNILKTYVTVHKPAAAKLLGAQDVTAETMIEKE